MAGDLLVVFLFSGGVFLQSGDALRLLTLGPPIEIWVDMRTAGQCVAGNLLDSGAIQSRLFAHLHARLIQPEHERIPSKRNCESHHMFSAQLWMSLPALASPEDLAAHNRKRADSLQHAEGVMQAARNIAQENGVRCEQGLLQRDWCVLCAMQVQQVVATDDLTMPISCISARLLFMDFCYA